MSKPISLTLKQWSELRTKLSHDYGQAVGLVSWRLRETFGFTVREHRDESHADWRQWITVKLDFYDEDKKTMFLLKYSDFIAEKTSTD